MKAIKHLNDTWDLMCSKNYNDRFRAEYYQLKIRYDRLKDMCEKWDAGTLDFTPTCPREIYTTQLTAMETYLTILRKRAELEKVEL